MSSQQYGRGRGRGYGPGQIRGRGRGRGRGRARGRGAAYYAALYGNHGRASTVGEHSVQPDINGSSNPRSSSVKGHLQDLSTFLHSVDGSQYPRYKGLYGTWHLSDSLSLTFDFIQADAYAAPSRARLRFQLSAAGFPPSLHSNRVRTTAFCHYLARHFSREASSVRLDATRTGSGWSSSKGGGVTIDTPGQHVVERTACQIHDGAFDLRVSVALPAYGRTIEGTFAAAVLTHSLPTVALSTLQAAGHDLNVLADFVQSIEDQHDLRARLPELGLIAFIADGAVLPRISGASDLPMMDDGVVKFESPPSLAVEVNIPSGRALRGMGIRQGVSLIVGGGFHGKSTLLAALQVGMYDKVPGDGREFVAILPDAVSVRAEDGRSVAGVDISPFINGLPFGKRTDHFSTLDASGSTSQAANIIEALSAGASVLLTDEDLAATNFMMRDSRMQKLVPAAKEPIIPMINRIRALYENEGVSSILVVGGAGDYFEVSDLVIMMDCYKPLDVTDTAKKIAGEHPSNVDRRASPKDLFKPVKNRRVSASSLRNIIEGGRGRVAARVVDSVRLGSEDIDLSAVAQIVELSQTRAIGAALQAIGSMPELELEGIVACVKKLVADIDKRGLDAVNMHGDLMGNYARPRAIEITAALNRLRGIEVLR